MAENMHGRNRNITGQSGDLGRRGSGLGTGPVGTGGGYGGRNGGGGSGGAPNRGSGSGGGIGKIIIIIIAAIAIFGGGGSILGNLFGGGNTNITQNTGIDLDIAGFLQNFTPANVSAGWSGESNVSQSYDTSVSDGAREKYTQVKGGGEDTITIMVYMCGTDLESKYGMATNDITEMLSADLSDKINLLIYTGGCQTWKKYGISNTTNQIYKIENKSLKTLVASDGNKSMTKPETLSSYINYCKNNYPADRYDLILWDHGSGTNGGFGYDTLHPSDGAMSIAGIQKALEAGGVKFDFVGFDACLMATAENALMLTKYADYMIASEETEPGIGWYYTTWLNGLSKNTSQSTLETGKNIIDGFVDTCKVKCSGQKTTLSLTDLSEFQLSVPQALSEFAASTTELIKSNNYSTVSKARGNTREFSVASKRDLVDLVHLAKNMNTQAGKNLAEAVLSAVKYNRGSSEMTNSYGISIYFPYNSTSKVSSAVSTYNAVGMDSEYADCIKQFASYETAGQAVSGGTANPISSIFGSSSGGTQSSSSITNIISSLLGGSFSGFTDGGDRSFLSELDSSSASSYIYGNQFDASNLSWEYYNGKKTIKMPLEQWKLVSDLELNVFIESDGLYLDLGLDTIYTIEDDRLTGEYDNAWVGINGRIVSFYHCDTSVNKTTGKVPVIINYEEGKENDICYLSLVFENNKAYVLGLITGYKNEKAESEAKYVNIEDALQDGDVISFVCDCYDKNGEYYDSYIFGDDVTYDSSKGLTVSDLYLPDNTEYDAVYRITDIYGQYYWTEKM